VRRSGRALFGTAPATRGTAPALALAAATALSLVVTALCALPVAAAARPAADAGRSPAAHGAHVAPAAVRRPAIVVAPLGHPGPLLGSRGQSPNWAGYDVTSGGPFTSAAADWTQPRVRPSAAYTDAAFWVGLDGDTQDPLDDPPQTVEQIGTEGFTLSGHVFYDAWYELYPAPARFISAKKLAVHAGDHLSASVVWTAAAARVAGFTLTLVNHTTGKTFTDFAAEDRLPIDPVRSSAEVVAEAPSLADQTILPLARFGLATYRDCAFEGQPIADFDWAQIGMVSADTGKVVAATSALGSDGATFAVNTDFRRPTTTVSGAAGWHDTAVTLVFKATDDPGGTGVAYTQYSLDGGATWTKGRSLTLAAPSDHSADGATVVWYRSADKAGNLEREHACTVRIDTQPPVPVVTPPAAVARGGRATVGFRVTDPRPGSPTVTVTLRFRDDHGRLVKKVVVPGRRVGAPLAYSFTCLLAKGSYRVTVSAVDAAGNPGSVAPSTSLSVL
jgi:hypothetical protein